MVIITDSRCTAYAQPGHPERPARITRTVERLKQPNNLSLNWAEPLAPTEAQILRAHRPELLARLLIPSDFDADTPTFPDIRAHAERSVGGALLALQRALRGEVTFSLMRPPGHHATRDTAMGFCYLNNIAIAVLEAQAQKEGKVAVFDFDVHHCNGTEAILLGQPGCALFSVHQHPGYPGTGGASRRNSHNYPVPPGAPREEYRRALTTALEDLRRFEPDLVAVSAGFDAYRGDPLSVQALEAEDFFWLGQSVRQLARPAFSVLEGGYSRELPDLILSYLQGLAGC